MKQKYFYYLLFCISSFFGYSQQGSYLNFDGTNDFLVSANAVTNNTQNQTYQVWFRIPSIPVNSDRILQRGSDGSGGWSLQIDVTSTGRLSGGISATTDTFLTGTTILTPNTWYQATFVFENNNSLRLYLNGNLEASVAIGNRTLRNSDNRLRIGTGNIASEFFSGDVDEVRVWSSALSQTEIMNTMNCELQGSETDLITYYKLNQGVDQANNASETTALDATSSANNGTLTGFALNGSTSNWLTGSPINTPGNPSVTTPVIYNQGDTASPLTATTGTNGTGLSWYTTATGGTGDTNAPTPSTASVGSTSYWVSSTNANGCESAREEIVVTVNALPATHLNFDGSNDFVNLGTLLSTALNGTTALTLEAWINPSVLNGWNNIITDYNGAYSKFLLRVRNNNNVQFVVNSTFLNSLITIPLNTWTHIAAVYDGTNMYVYVNGNLIASQAAPASLPTGTPQINIGSRIGSNTENFTGDIDEVRVWNVARTPEQINGSMDCELQGSETGLLAYYKFNQGFDAVNNSAETTLTATTGPNGTLSGFALNGSTSNWLDGSPVTTGSVVPGNPSAATPITYTQGDTASALTATTGTNGTGLLWYTTATGGTGDTTAPTPSTASVGSTSYWVSSTNANGCESERVEIVVTVNAPIPATHLNFDGSNDFVDLGNTLTTTLNGANFFTVEAWVYTPSVTGTKTIVGNHISNGAQFNLRIINDRLNGFLGFGAYDLNSPAGTIVANTWQHVAMVYNDTTLKLYIDGTEVASMAIPVAYSLQNTVQPYRIGASGYGGEFFNGNIDDVRIWNVVKTPDQLAASKNCELLGNEPGLLRYYKLNQGFDAVDNSAITSATDATANANNGTLNGFTLNGSTSNWLAGSPVTTGSLVPGNPSVTTPVTYNQGDTASSLTATTGTNGTGLLWYTAATGGMGDTTAPTPSTATAGSTSYWVSSTNANGCESERVEIVVNVNANATHLNFDGTNDLVVSANAITNNTQNQTYQAWIRIPAIPTNGDIFLQRGIDGTGGWSVTMGVNSTGRLYAGISATPDTFITGTTVLNTNTWYHVTFVFENNNSLRLYLDANLEASVAIGNRTLRNSDNRLRVGQGNVASEFFRGDIDEVRVWDVALSVTDILATKDCELDNTQTNVVVYYKFNQGFDQANNTAITSATDDSGNGNNGTLIDMALTGAVSNWASGSAVTTGNTCPLVLSSDNFAQNSLVVYPNPTKGFINIQSVETVSVEVYDMIGKLILSKKIENEFQNLDLTNFPTGIYLLKATNTNGFTQTHKIIKE